MPPPEIGNMNTISQTFGWINFSFVGLLCLLFPEVWNKLSHFQEDERGGWQMPRYKKTECLPPDGSRFGYKGDLWTPTEKETTVRHSHLFGRKKTKTGENNKQIELIRRVRYDPNCPTEPRPADTLKAWRWILLHYLNLKRVLVSQYVLRNATLMFHHTAESKTNPGYNVYHGRHLSLAC